MSTYLGWTVFTMPTDPPAPASIDLAVINIVSGNTSPFTGQQQTYDWNANFMRATVIMPPMQYAAGQTWVAFLRSLKGNLGVFQFSAAFMAGYPNDVGTRYWRIIDSTVKWSISQDHFYRIQFELREAT